MEKGESREKYPRTMEHLQRCSISVIRIQRGEKKGIEKYLHKNFFQYFKINYTDKITDQGSSENIRDKSKQINKQKTRGDTYLNYSNTDCPKILEKVKAGKNNL